MKLLRRILIGIVRVVVTLVILFAAVYWVAEVAFSYYAAKAVSPIAKVVPFKLIDESITTAPGMKLAYFGYSFEIPWTDLDETQTKLYPKDKTPKNRVVLTFRSGLRVIVTAVEPHEFEKEFHEDMHISPARFRATFGKDDYNFVKTVYEFTPDKMHHWTISRRVHSREESLLIIKFIMLLQPADTGIFYIQNENFKGFQQGNPQIRQDKLAVNLYAEDGSLEMIFFQKDYHSQTGVTQSEINRIIQSVSRGSVAAIVSTSK